MHTIAPGVYTLPLEFEWEGTTWTIHPAAVETETGLLLLDTGFSHHAEELDSHLREAGFSFADVELICVTHQDRDHAGAVREVTARTGAITLAHEDAVPYIEGKRDLLKGGDYPSQTVDIELVDGVVFRTAAGPMRVVATPGHTPGHISLYLSDEQLLIASDAITALEAFDGPDEDATLDMGTATASVGRLAEFDVTRTLCFHGGLVEHDAGRLQRIYESLSEKLV